ncbi:hypothetical protein [Mycolicibacterium phocaicum]|uniref:hypothetical protein n=1 Tax=Mycolicibacterium phocaicum TaxID=319706 RepID=UPI001CFBFC35|nr:hypothetical protein [Mycolicibacterium phocaicum]UCZ59985.1 hypothetical protein LHJ73_25525 [Mycolicibacterium phocaicum]
MKRITDFSAYANVLPYASEIFGVYQPLLGWRAKRMANRWDRGFAVDKAIAFESLYKKFKSQFELTLDERKPLAHIANLKPAQLRDAETRFGGSFVLESVARSLPALADYHPSVWERAIVPAEIQRTLDKVVIPKTQQWHTAALSRDTAGAAAARRSEGITGMVADQLSRESAVAGFILYLKENQHFDELKNLFYRPDKNLGRLLALLKFRDPLEYMDPFRDLDRVSLSPLGIVHLFRQYFFEFDTFLGPPVGHVWLSPGATVELVEISTRKTLQERMTESSTETVLKSEKSTTEQDELSDAVKTDNKSDTKFGVDTTANQSWIGGSASASANIDIGKTQSTAREVTHKRMREQTEKLSTEIRKNYKTTFRTVTETTDTSSRRYVLANHGDKLLNYELRRKMRQVGVQIQDIGTYLCWQTYVDDPGRQLGVANLVHLAKDPDLGSVPPPESIPMPTPFVTEHPIDIPFVPMTEDTIPEDDMDEAYKDGKEVNLDTNEGDPERIKADFDGFVAVCDRPGYEFGPDGKVADGIIEFDYGGNDIEISVQNLVEGSPGDLSFGVHLEHVNFRNVSPLRVTAKVTWQPTQAALDEVNAKNTVATEKFTEQTRREYEKAFVEAARDRINKASNIEPRPFEDLREEERIIVYRSLIQEMLTKDLPMPDDRTRHVVSELLNTIFDVDKMLYFVAPEWWRPRLHQSHQSLGGLRKPSDIAASPAQPAAKSGSIFSQLKSEATKNVITSAVSATVGHHSQIASMDTVSWGGADNRVDDYYITEESHPAKLGASLGWLLQLDGDNLRNAFLNAPWVKAVIPIRPGKERAAMNWLQRLHIEGTDGLDDQYVAPPDELAEIPHAGPAATVRDAINHLCDVVAKKHNDSLKVGRYPTEEIDDDNRVSATPIDKVYEHGFYPLDGGFRATPGTEDFQVFDQWVEVLPTDQVVPVEVTYDPKTGRQV